jgi:hypothetical protein
MTLTLKKDDDEMYVISHDGKHETSDMSTATEQKSGGKRPLTHNEMTPRVELHDDIPKPPKKIRMDKNRSPQRERIRSKTRRGPTQRM